MVVAENRAGNLARKPGNLACKTRNLARKTGNLSLQPIRYKLLQFIYRNRLQSAFTDSSRYDQGDIASADLLVLHRRISQFPCTVWTAKREFEPFQDL